MKELESQIRYCTEQLAHYLEEEVKTLKKIAAQEKLDAFWLNDKLKSFQCTLPGYLVDLVRDCGMYRAKSGE